ncbi:nitrate reductase cytochrome c-type subunit [Campylobacter pinnipediorum]|uniref:nitrate reductase cytochrome c-type subunit n=1 Tax=Campylobacter pinnipediorum TaxID=1965231 RepID=UPI00084DFBD6|nr:nitrate reductase cytochrome c-type subunit [Campylobacter pinnipediorum]OPA76540.1 nitrate reductase [Campylobacter pinnipediorum subsp. pinnipediorum]
MKIKIISSAILVFLLAACDMPSKTVSDTEIGIRKVELSNEKDVVLKDINWTAAPAGESKKFDRSFENAPPFIPHDTEGLVPITKDMNMCVTCHMPEFAADSGATAIPASHLYDIRNKKDLQGVLDDERFVCTTCHVPQANTDTPFKNNFKADFRNPDSKTKSNLLEILNDGVR